MVPHLEGFQRDVAATVDAAVVAHKVVLGHAVLDGRVVQVRVEHHDREGQNVGRVCVRTDAPSPNANVVPACEQAPRTSCTDSCNRPLTWICKLCGIGGVVARCEPLQDAVDLLRLGRQHETGQDLSLKRRRKERAGGAPVGRGRQRDRPFERGGAERDGCTDRSAWSIGTPQKS